MQQSWRVNIETVSFFGLQDEIKKTKKKASLSRFVEQDDLWFWLIDLFITKQQLM